MKKGQPPRGGCPFFVLTRGGSLRRRECYLTETVAPADSRASLALSAVSLLAASMTGFGALSTSSLASFRPRLVRLRTSLMTWIFFSPMDSRTTSNSSFSSAAAASPPAPPAAGAAATATGAAAVTPKVSSNCFTNSLSSRRVISLKVSSRSSVLIFAIVACLSGSELVAGVGAWLLCGLAVAVGRRLGLGLSDLGLGGLGGLGRGGLGLGGRVFLELGLQGAEHAGRVGQWRVEQRDGVLQGRLQRAGELGEQHVAGLEVGE